MGMTMQIAEIDLTKYSNQFASYTELRLHENRAANIGILNGDVITNVSDKTSGVSARVFDQGAWGFSASPDFSNSSIEAAIAAATRNAAFLAKRAGDPSAILPRSNASGSSDFTTKKTRLSQEQKVAFMRRIDQYIVKHCPDIVARHVSLSSLDMEKKLQTSEGSHGHNTNTRTVIYVKLNTRNEKGEPIELMESYGARGQFEDVFTETTPVEAMVDKLYKRLLDKKRAVRPVSGYHEVILASELAGILAHEAIGHTT